MNRDFRGILVFCMSLVVLIGCTTLGLSQPQTFNQKWMYATSSVTSARLTAKDLLNSGRITVAQAKDAQTKADSIRSGLDVALSASLTGDVSTAEGKLAAAQASLTLLQDFLKSKGGSP